MENADDLKEIEWRPVVGYEDCYEVSNIGGVRRTIDRYGKAVRRERLPSWAYGYPRFTLYKRNANRTIAAHRLVWEAFVGAIPKGMQINHKDGVRHNNDLANLEVCTPSENTLHSFQVLGKQPSKNPKHGSENGRAKLHESDLPEIRRLRGLGWTQQQIADKFGINQTNISRVLLGTAWRLPS